MNKNTNIEINCKINNYFNLVPISTVEKLSHIDNIKVDDLLKIINNKEDYKPGNVICGVAVNDIKEKYGFVWNTQYHKVIDATSDYEYRVYSLWASMIRRAYGKRKYENCTVCDRWLYFSNFINDISKIPGFSLWLNNESEEKICLDKDIKSRINEDKYNKIGNEIKEYSLDNCMFVPESINHLVAKTSLRRRGDCPIGVSHKRNKFRSYIDTSNIKNIKKIDKNSQGKDDIIYGRISLGVFEDKHEAFLMYKFNKELLIQGIAEYMYKNNEIYEELYKALLEYKIKESD